MRQERAKLQGAVADLEQRFSTASSELATTKHHAAEEARLSSEQSGAQLNSLRAQLADARASYELRKQAIEAAYAGQGDSASGAVSTEDLLLQAKADEVKTGVAEALLLEACTYVQGSARRLFPNGLGADPCT